jgi:hypothetical protein
VNFPGAIILAGLSLTACQAERTIRYPLPAGAADPGPAIAISSSGDNGVVAAGQAVVHGDTTVLLRPLGEVVITATATDPVAGISSFGLRITRRTPVSPSSRPLYAVGTHTAMNAGTGRVPETLVITGSNSAGGPGSTPLKFALDGYDVVTAIATARSAAGLTKTIVVTYQPAGGAILQPDTSR